MRIIAGEWRGRRLVTAEGMATRPTADRVRETLFSMLSSRLGSFDQLRVADLYAGSGAFGLESLSRGAAFACFVEQDARALAAIRKNVGDLRAEGRTRILARSVEALPPAEPFDLVFADPPYARGSGSAALRQILKSDWAQEGAWLAVESRRGDPVDPQGLAVDVERDIGRARVTLLRV